MIKDEIWLEKIRNEVETQMRRNNIEGFKATIKNLDKSAMKVLKVRSKSIKSRENA